MRWVLGIILAGVCAGGCATTSDACARVEACLRRCESAGTNRESRERWNVQGQEGSTCDRQCGGCVARPWTSTSTPPSGKPTPTGSSP